MADLTVCYILLCLKFKNVYCSGYVYWCLGEWKRPFADPEMMPSCSPSWEDEAWGVQPMSIFMGVSYSRYRVNTGWKTVPDQSSPFIWRVRMWTDSLSSQQPCPNRDPPVTLTTMFDLSSHYVIDTLGHSLHITRRFLFNSYKCYRATPLRTTSFML